MARPLGKDIFEGAKFITSNGELKVIKYYHAKKVLVRFTETGFETIAASDNIRRNKIKDLMRPSVCGVGYLGVPTSSHPLDRKAYICWQSMMRRCYSDTEQEKCPTYKGCTVDSRWHNFQAFLSWYKEVYPNDGKKYQIDKDILVKGNRIYSADTCLMVTAQENLAEMCNRALSRQFLFISPLGVVTHIKNMSMFCKQNGLIPTNMSAVHCGRAGSYKGWVRVKIPLISDEANNNA